LAHIIDRQVVEVNERWNLAPGPKEEVSQEMGGQEGEEDLAGCFSGVFKFQEIKTGARRSFNR
jgi:hypothetical protein